MKLILLGDAGAGKSTMEQEYSASLVRGDREGTERKPREASGSFRFIEHNDQWIIEGCYSDLVEAIPWAHGTSTDVGARNSVV